MRVARTGEIIMGCVCVILLLLKVTLSQSGAPQITNTSALHENVSHETKENEDTVILFSYLHQHCGYGVADGKECDPTANLMCDEFERSQWAKCICINGTHPHPEKREICVPPVRRLILGDKCNSNAAEDEESCVNDLAVCGSNGTCVCGDDGWGQILHDEEHNACYLKSQPRHVLPSKNGAEKIKNYAIFMALHSVILIGSWI